MYQPQRRLVRVAAVEHFAKTASVDWSPIEMLGLRLGRPVNLRADMLAAPGLDWTIVLLVVARETSLRRMRRGVGGFPLPPPRERDFWDE